jgi:hypothetical protein
VSNANAGWDQSDGAVMASDVRNDGKDERSAPRQLTNQGGKNGGQRDGCATAPISGESGEGQKVINGDRDVSSSEPSPPDFDIFGFSC